MDNLQKQTWHDRLLAVVGSTLIVTWLATIASQIVLRRQRKNRLRVIMGNDAVANESEANGTC